MPPASCRPPVLLATLALAGAATLSGCASRPTEYDPRRDAPRSVSAREYGYVRPATDVRVRDEAPRVAYSGRIGDDVWDRVRHGRRLGIDHHTRVERALAAMKRNPNYLTGLTRRASPYLHLIVEELERHGLPAELALLPEIESRYNPRAVSHMSATGMWQFMPYTGREMGLVQNGMYDGRNDILASTRGAIAYLTQLRDQFDGDWALALAAYNAGPGRVRGAQRANAARGQPTDYWSLNLPSETQHYVPKLLAVIDLVRSPDRHGLTMPQIENRPALALIETRSQIDLAQAARLAGVPLTTLRDLNPGLKQGKTLPEGPHRVLVPAASANQLRTALARNGELIGPVVAETERRRRWFSRNNSAS